MPSQAHILNKSFPTQITLERLFARVSSNVRHNMAAVWGPIGAVGTEVDLAANADVPARPDPMVSPSHALPKIMR